MMYDYPKATTERSKRTLKRKVRRAIRILNKHLREDIFGNRFSLEIETADIRPWDDNSGWNAHFLIKFKDAAHPERNYSYWFSPHFIIYSGLFAGGRHVDTEMNDFIINSDFWKEYYKGKE